MTLPLGIEVPCAVVSEMNNHDHWAKRLRRKSAQQNCLLAILLTQGIKADGVKIKGQLKVTLTRLYCKKKPKAYIRQTNIVYGYSFGKPMDKDNLSSAFKWLQDGVAQWLGRDDGDGTVDWRYAQEENERGPMVLVKIEKA